MRGGPGTGIPALAPPEVGAKFRPPCPEGGGAKCVKTRAKGVHGPRLSKHLHLHLGLNAQPSRLCSLKTECDARP